MNKDRARLTFEVMKTVVLKEISKPMVQPIVSGVLIGMGLVPLVSLSNSIVSREVSDVCLGAGFVNATRDLITIAQVKINKSFEDRKSIKKSL